MIKLTLKYDCFLDSDFENYLLTIKGIEFGKVDTEKEEICIEYNENIINLKVIIMEIDLYLNTSKTPSLISFNKHSKEPLIEDEINITNLCCEYCLKSNVENLLFVDGIESANTDYDYDNHKNVKIFIKYNDKKLKKEDIEKLEKGFN